MKKILPYILILIVLVGILSPVIYLNAQITITPPIVAPFCVDPTGKKVGFPEEICKPPNKWITTTPTPAPADPNYYLLAPLPGIDEKIDTSDKGAFGDYLNLMIKLIIGIAAVLAVIMIVIGGMEYMTSELISSKEAGRTRMTQAVLGLLIALGAYALLYTINPDLLKSEIDIPEAKVTVDLDVDVPQKPINGKFGIYTAGLDWATTAGSETALPPLVSRNNPECKIIGDQNCTSTRKLDLSIVRKIRTACPTCQVTITGGTESWLHKLGSSHKPGSSTVDIKPTAELNQYITGGTTPPVKKRYLKHGVSYLFEGNHWHAGP